MDGGRSSPKITWVMTKTRSGGDGERGGGEISWRRTGSNRYAKEVDLQEHCCRCWDTDIYFSVKCTVHVMIQQQNDSEAGDYKKTKQKIDCILKGHFQGAKRRVEIQTTTSQLLLPSVMSMRLKAKMSIVRQTYWYVKKVNALIFLTHFVIQIWWLEDCNHNSSRTYTILTAYRRCYSLWIMNSWGQQTLFVPLVVSLLSFCSDGLA